MFKQVGGSNPSLGVRVVISSIQIDEMCSQLHKQMVLIRWMLKEKRRGGGGSFYTSDFFFITDPPNIFQFPASFSETMGCSPAQLKSNKSFELHFAKQKCAYIMSTFMELVL